MTMLEIYPKLKASHAGFAMLTIMVFTVRGLGVLAGMRWPMHKLPRIGSMVIDTLLLATAVALLAAMQFSMLNTPWLQLKLVLLVAYVVLGVFALKRAPTRSGKALAFVAALLCYAHMYGMARHKDVLGWFAM